MVASSLQCFNAVKFTSSLSCRVLVTSLTEMIESLSAVCFTLYRAPIDESLDVSFDLAASEGQFCELFGQMCFKCEVQKCQM